MRTKYLREYLDPTDTDAWRKAHNDEIHNLYYSPNIITIIKQRDAR